MPKDKIKKQIKHKELFIHPQTTIKISDYYYYYIIWRRLRAMYMQFMACYSVEIKREKENSNK